MPNSSDEPIAKPFTPAQRRLFHHLKDNPEDARRQGMSREEASRLAREADDLAREGKEKKPKSKGFIDLSSVWGR